MAKTKTNTTAVDDAKAAVTAAVVERADRNDEQSTEIEQMRDELPRHALDHYLRHPKQFRALEEQLHGSNIDPADFVRSLVTLVTTNDALANAVPTHPAALRLFNRSVLRCALNIAALRLDPNPHYGHAWVVPFNTSMKIDGADMKVALATLIVGYQGYVTLAARVGWEIDGGHIWSGQEFTYDRWHPERSSLGLLTRVPAKDETPQNTWIMLTNTMNGRPRLIVEPYEWYLRARESSQSWLQDVRNQGRWENYKPKSPWNTAPLPMVLKTAVRWNRKLIPMGDSGTEHAVRWAHAHRLDGAVFAPLREDDSPRTFQLNPGRDTIGQDGEPDDPTVSNITIEAALAESSPYRDTAWYLAEIRGRAGGADVAGHDITPEVAALCDTHGYDPEIAMPVLAGEKLDPDLPRELLVAVHSLIVGTEESEPPAE